MRTWLRIDAAGDSSALEADKFAIAHQLAVPLRDLRILDPNISTAPAHALLVRDRALVVSLEAVKAIITADQVLLLNAEDSSEFVEEMKSRLRSGFVEEMKRQRSASLKASALLRSSVSAPDLPMGGEKGGGGGGDSNSVELPFELRALEVCLEAVCTLLERAYGELEAAAHPALDALTLKVNSSNLERVRKIKSRITRLTTRVVKVRPRWGWAFRFPSLRPAALLRLCDPWPVLPRARPPSRPPFNFLSVCRSARSWSAFWTTTATCATCT